MKRGSHYLSTISRHLGLEFPLRSLTGISTSMWTNQIWTSLQCGGWWAFWPPTEYWGGSSSVQSGREQRAWEGVLGWVATPFSQTQIFQTNSDIMVINKVSWLTNLIIGIIWSKEESEQNISHQQHLFFTSKQFSLLKNKVLNVWLVIIFSSSEKFQSASSVEMPLSSYSKDSSHDFSC